MGMHIIYSLVENIRRQQALSFEDKMQKEKLDRDRLRDPQTLTASGLLEAIDKSQNEEATQQGVAQEAPRDESKKQSVPEPRGNVPLPPTTDG